MLHILFIGDIVGRPGRKMVTETLTKVKQELPVDIVIANGENAAGGVGLTPETADELFSYGINIITLGNHAWDKKAIYNYLDSTTRVIRPANQPGAPPGQGLAFLALPSGQKLAVINLMGRAFFNSIMDCPFRAADDLVETARKTTNLIVVDFHAEATSEKAALGWYLDGKVSAIIGTHTHVQTADERILPQGSAYITDVGMTGPYDSVIGFTPKLVIERFLTQMPVRFEVATGPRQFSALWMSLDEKTGKTTAIKRIFHNELTDNVK